jgi:Bacteriophage minor capsid protein
MLAYVDVETYVSVQLTTLGYSRLPVFTPGPATDLNVQDLSPNEIVIITVGGGAGMDSELLFDRPGVQIRTIGRQDDYNSAEALAQAVDKTMGDMGIYASATRTINGKRVLSIVRTGGAPSLLLKDDGDRYHFTCNYIWEVVY